MSSKIERTVFALLGVGLAVHAAHALIGPGDGPLDHAIASWVYTGVMWVASAMCLLAVRNVAAVLAGEPPLTPV